MNTFHSRVTATQPDLGPSTFSRARVRVHWRLTSTSTLVMDEYEYEYIPMNILSNVDVYNHTSDHTY